MEPALTTTVVAALLDVGASYAAAPPMSFLRRRTIRVRAAFAASREAKARGIRVSRRAIHRWLARSDVQDQLRVGTAHAIESTVNNLGWVIAGDPERRERRAPELLFVILIELIRTYDPSAATAHSAAWISQQIASDGKATRDTVNASTTAILDQLSAARVFPDDLRSFHPWRRAAAEALCDVWPDIAGFVHALARSTERGALLRQWASSPPEPFLIAPADACCWFGELAAEHGEWAAAAELLKCAIDRGAFPRNYWLARAALYVEQVDHPRAEVFLAEAADPHPLGRALSAIHEGELGTATETLRQWQPERADDDAIKSMLLSQCLAAQQNLNGAIAVALEGSYDDNASGVALQAANLLLQRVRSDKSDHPLADADQAFALAIRARNARRTWAGDSAAASLVAVDAAARSADIHRAWELTQPPEATLLEAKDIRVRREAAVLAAMMGQMAHARELAAATDDPYISATVNGFAALENHDAAAAHSAWMTAFDIAADDSARLMTISQLAELGDDLPDLTELERRHPKQVHELKTLHELYSSGDETLPVLRSRAHESPLLTARLAEIYTSRGNYADAARTLEDGGTRWNDPLLMRMAADRHLRAGDHPEAQRTAEAAIALGGPRWFGEFRAGSLFFRRTKRKATRTRQLSRPAHSWRWIQTIWMSDGPSCIACLAKATPKEPGTL
jgi:hypothetical protein